MKYEAIFFDMDGTVADTLGNIAAAVNRALRHFGMPEYEAERLKPLLGYGARQLLERVAPAGTAEAEVDELLAYYLPYYSEHASEHTPPYDGVLPMLSRLKERSIPVAILSNKPDAAVQPVIEAYFSELVDLAVGERKGVRRKPDPDMLETAAEQLGVALSRCLYVGDTEVDIETAKNAGIDCVSVSWGFRSVDELKRAGASIIIDKPEDLIPLLEGEQRP